MLSVVTDYYGNQMRQRETRKNIVRSHLKLSPSKVARNPRIYLKKRSARAKAKRQADALRIQGLSDNNDTYAEFLCA